MMVHKDQLLLHNTQNMLDSDFYNPKICEGCDTVITDLYIMKVCGDNQQSNIDFIYSIDKLKKGFI